VGDYPPEKIWHLKGFGYNGLEGLSPIGMAREALGLSMAGEERRRASSPTA
jgi:phage portal protein BeeE